MTLVANDVRFHPPQHFDNAAQWLHALGDIPLHRIIMDPWPGTATEADLLRFVERDKRLCELIDGTLVEKPVGIYESIIAINLGAELMPYAKKLGAVISGADSTLRMMITGRIRLPDLCYFAPDQLQGGTVPHGPVPTLSPAIAVEVLSESNTPAEIQQKLREYFQSGTRLAWIIDPEQQTIAIYHAAGEPTRVLSVNDELDGEQIVPGFSIRVSELFRGVRKQ